MLERWRRLIFYWLAPRSCAAFMLLSLLTLSSPEQTTAQWPLFGKAVDMGLVQDKAINEASGLVASRRNPGVLWIHNDSGDKSRLFAVDEKGVLLATCTLADVTARDWEDITIGPGPGVKTSYLYVGDIGDNGADHKKCYLYRLEEPEVLISDRGRSITISAVDRLTYIYPDGARDAETLMADPQNGDVYVVSKRDTLSRVYRLPAPLDINETMSAEFVCELSFNMAVGGDLSPAGDEALIKNYVDVYYWKRPDGQTWAQAFRSAPVRVPYEMEPQGEAICWKWDGSGYITVSEELFNIESRIYFYPRLPSLLRYEEKSKAAALNLLPNYPNPFNASTTFTFSVPETSDVSLVICNELGQEVAVLFQQRAQPGTYRVQWSPSRLHSGTFLARLQSDTTQLTQKIQLVK